MAKKQSIRVEYQVGSKIKEAHFSSWKSYTEWCAFEGNTAKLIKLYALL